MEEEGKAEGEGAGESPFEMSPEQATGFGDTEAPGRFNRRRAAIAISAALALAVGGGLLINAGKPGGKADAAETETAAADNSSAFLSSLRDQAARRAASEGSQQPPGGPPSDSPPAEPEPLLPPASISRPPEPPAARGGPPPAAPPDPAYAAPPAPPPDMAPVYRAPLVPPIEGSLFASRQQQQAAPYGAAPYGAAPYGAAGSAAPGGQAQGQQGQARSPYGSQASEYALQNDQGGKQSFYDPSPGGGGALNGRWLGENSVWIGTMIPGVLETAINTDLPGNVLARVTRNIYDSQTGRALLIPQGTVLVARYSSSVSYAQRRVQIVWDTMIRPDGFQIDLDGQNGVDRSGMSGQAAVYHENWFEYLKAAGLVTLFSLANARMAETAAQYAQDESSAAAVARSNSDFVNQLGGNLVGRAMNIQPTLTVASGTPINIMLSKPLYLPPVEARPAAQK